MLAARAWLLTTGLCVLSGVESKIYLIETYDSPVPSPPLVQQIPAKYAGGQGGKGKNGQKQADPEHGADYADDGQAEQGKAKAAGQYGEKLDEMKPDKRALEVTTVKPIDGYGETLPPSKKPEARALEVTTLKEANGYSETLPPTKKPEARALQVTKQEQAGGYGETLSPVKKLEARALEVTTPQQISGYGETLPPVKKPEARALKVTSPKPAEGYAETLPTTKKLEGRALEVKTVKAEGGYGETLPPAKKPEARALKATSTMPADGYAETLPPAKKPDVRALKATTLKPADGYAETLPPNKADEEGFNPDGKHSVTLTDGKCINTTNVGALETPAGGKVLQLPPVKAAGKHGDTVQLAEGSDYGDEPAVPGGYMETLAMVANHTGFNATVVSGKHGGRQLHVSTSKPTG